MRPFARRCLLLFPAAWLTGCRTGEEERSVPETVEIMSFDDNGAPIAPGAVSRTVRTPAEWREKLSPQQFYVLRHASTDTPFSGTYFRLHTPGLYRCAGCGTVLFRSEEKFDSGTGWPSFTAPADPRNIATKKDTSYSVERTEVLCRRCAGHLGHVFDDGPPPSNLRYCINESALRFVKRPSIE